MSLCVVGAKTLAIAVNVFTLSWTHSVQKTLWQERWRVEAGGLRIVEARVEGSGAGMEAGEGAKFDGRFWRWTPNLPLLPQLLLRRSDAVPQGWTLCAAGTCRAIGDYRETADVVVLVPCRLGPLSPRQVR